MASDFHDREIEADHYGVLIPYVDGQVPERLVEVLGRRRPDLDDPRQLVPSSWSELTDLIERFVDVGTSKFVILPISEPRSDAQWIDHIAEAAQIVLPLERG